MIKIRKAKLHDIRELLELWQCLMDYHQALDANQLPLKKNAKTLMEPFFTKNIRGKDSLVLVAEEDKKLVGYLMGFVRNIPPVYIEDKMAYISDGFVIKEYRNKSIMKKMIEESKSFFRNKKMKHIYLMADTTNKKGLISWKRIGFKEECKEMYMKLK
ncbi:MAG: GNAT family N-acetyltransferase [Nanoarchaeota archaeon]|nr:GNAT family N-acetyltransferase [Nanoarchaeota archaeon]